MNTVSIFKDVTTNDHILALEEEVKTYVGLYVDMNEDDARKFVKDKVVDVNGLIKRVERIRIDNPRAYKKQVDSEALELTTRLEKTIMPFTDLISKHKAARQKILDAAKAVEVANELYSQKQRDHEEGLLINKVWAFEKAEKLAAEEKRISDIKEQAAAEATEKAEAQAQYNAHKLERDRQARLAAEVFNDAQEKAAVLQRQNDKEHQRVINNEVLESLKLLGLDNDLALKVTFALARKQVPHTTINY